MSYKIIEIEGVGPALAEKLTAAGVRTTAALLLKAADPKGRKALAAATGIPEAQVLRFANHADLMRIRGVASQMAELLEASGVDTVKELKTRNPEALCKKMQEVNAAKKLTRRAPSLKQCAAWIEEAKSVAAALTY